MVRRERVIDDPPVAGRNERAVETPSKPARRSRAEKPAPGQRVIHAEAEVTILGPDRMSIRLYRKRESRDANAKVD